MDALRVSEPDLAHLLVVIKNKLEHKFAAVDGALDGMFFQVNYRNVGESSLNQFVRVFCDNSRCADTEHVLLNVRVNLRAVAQVVCHKFAVRRSHLKGLSDGGRLLQARLASGFGNFFGVQFMQTYLLVLLLSKEIEVVVKTQVQNALFLDKLGCAISMQRVLNVELRLAD